MSRNSLKTQSWTQDGWVKTFYFSILAFRFFVSWRINVGPLIFIESQAALMLDSGRFNLQANTDKIQHLLTFVRGWLKYPIQGWLKHPIQGWLNQIHTIIMLDSTITGVWRPKYAFSTWYHLHVEWLWSALSTGFQRKSSAFKHFLQN